MTKETRRTVKTEEPSKTWPTYKLFWQLEISDSKFRFKMLDKRWLQHWEALVDGKQNTGATQEVIMSVVFSVLENSNIIFRLNCAITVFERIRNTRNSVSFRGRVTSSSTRPRYKVENPSILMTFGDLEKADAPLVQAPWRDRGQQHRHSLPRGRCSCGGRFCLWYIYTDVTIFIFDKQGDGTNFGLWSDYVLCPDDTAVCGIKTKVFIPSFKIESTISKEVIL